MKEKTKKTCAPVFIGSAGVYLKSIRSFFLKIPMAEPDWMIEEIKLALTCPVSKRPKGMVLELEKKLCDIFCTRYSIATSSGRVAIKAALLALGIGGFGVVLPTFACMSILEAVLQAGCYPKFIDVDENLNMDTDCLEKVIDEKTKAVLVPHMYGKFSNMAKILEIAKKCNLIVIDDSAQSIGLKVKDKFLGTFGDVGIFSFGPFKPISGIGGGAVVTNRADVYEKIKKMCTKQTDSLSEKKRAIKILLKSRLRRYSYLPFMCLKYLRTLKSKNNSYHFHSEEFSLNRMGELEAEFVLGQLSRLEDRTKKRIMLGNLLFNKLLGLKHIRAGFSDPNNHLFFKFPIKLSCSNLNDSEKLLSFLLKKGIESEPAYVPIHLRTQTKAYAPKIEENYLKLLCLPINPLMKTEDIDYVFNTLRRFEERYVS